LRDARWDVAGGVKVIHNDGMLQVVRDQWRNFCSMEMRLGALKRKAEREMGVLVDVTIRENPSQAAKRH
jgi:hypothetical protein